MGLAPFHDGFDNVRRRIVAKKIIELARPARETPMLSASGH
jgi:hypothetical protein